MHNYKHDYHLLASILKSCASLSAIKPGKAHHASILKLGLISSHYLTKSLLNMYAKCGAFTDSTTLFRDCTHDDPVFWNILLSGFAASRDHDLQTLSLFSRMLADHRVKPSSVTAAIVLPVCARVRDIHVGKCLHCYLVKAGLEMDTLAGNALVSMYAKCGMVRYDAYAAFDSIYDKDVVSWNAIIAGLSENKLVDSALRLFSLMPKCLIRPNHATITNILPLFASLGSDTAYFFGKEIHCYALRHYELLADVSVWNAMLSFYLTVGHVNEAELLFRRMGMRDLISWNAIISGYASNGKWSKSLELFQELLSLGSNAPDSVTLLSILPACAQLQNLKVGRAIHGYVMRHLYLCQDTSVGNALVSLYAKCDNLEAAYHTFLMMPSRDLISWNSMLDAFIEGGHNAQFLELLQRMNLEGIRPDSITVLTILHFCANVIIPYKAKETHCYALRCGFLQSDAEPTTRNAILDTYARCGNIEYAFKIFQCLSENRNLVTFNSMISGYVNCGLYDDACVIFKKMPASDLTTWNLMVRGCVENDRADQAFDLFRQLQARGMKPDAVTIMGLLPACAQMAAVLLMKECHGYVIRACFDDARLEGALLDLYAKCGSIGYASKLFQSNPERDLVTFTAMVGGYAMHGMGEEAIRIFSDMLESGVKPDHIVITAVLSACCHSGLVDEGLKIFYSIENVHGMRPTMEQYCCVVDLLARGGRIDDAYSLVTGMRIQANANVWGALLGACRIYHEVELGHTVAKHLFKIEANNIGNYVVMSNLFAADARWDRVMEIRKQMRTRDLKKPAGCSWIEVEKRKNIFVAGDFSHPQRSNIYTSLQTLDFQIKEPFHLHKLPDTTYNSTTPGAWMELAI
ncbi:putative pentatricopeptide repeat-containing protein At5g08490 [Mercurialis annua]|uniref:putative pentatricopeptide repeat-containing protein At5g08490 n=1 Tax=Mercurialis annua TaxID=3986 RepID=UPI00215F2378|nr:putative pentatricopeptide repeat-containing protein At5g08490 [Mercurialis annua]XP_050204751.1 putative pentatricopeptide repeat-containing protein At5g08490 [Mercurialis annua]XP_050204752.1 putative pentatricopeptide repeat-containing protein At5g08490 [Mercurialis annua]XP_050204753.1 putative pentatricopeptide repeat-containing protein At5g08490 [Mercurialis annua]XP_050204754.1 putative pentatricopeptide repeat-containing protein At5g08490 [Mercurialis annua]